MRKESLVNNQVYHIFSRSIAGFNIFNTDVDYSRTKQLFAYYQRSKPDIRFSRFNKLGDKNKIDFYASLRDNDKLVDIIAYCIMPTHLHLVLRQKKEKGISIFMNNILNSYTRFFNTKHERKGPLWESRFKSVLVETNEYLLHLTRYVHLNPVSAELSQKADFWGASSYSEYLGTADKSDSICDFQDIIEVGSDEYKTFVEERAEYQKELQKIKHLIID